MLQFLFSIFQEFKSIRYKSYLLRMFQDGFPVLQGMFQNNKISKTIYVGINTFPLFFLLSTIFEIKKKRIEKVCSVRITSKKKFKFFYMICSKDKA